MPSSLVLVIDDDPGVGRSIRRVLASEEGLEIDVVTTAEEALSRIVAGYRPDAILCDVHLSEMSGIDFYNQLLVLAPRLAPSVVFMTGADLERSGWQRSSNPILEKPFDLAKLRSLVRAITQGSKGT